MQRSIRALVKAGWFEVIHQAKNGKKTVNRYVPNWQQVDRSPMTDPDGSSMTGRPVIHDQSDRSKMTGETGHQRPIEPSEYNPVNNNSYGVALSGAAVCKEPLPEENDLGVEASADASAQPEANFLPARKEQTPPLGDGGVSEDDFSDWPEGRPEGPMDAAGTAGPRYAAPAALPPCRPRRRPEVEDEDEDEAEPATPLPEPPPRFCYHCLTGDEELVERRHYGDSPIWLHRACIPKCSEMLRIVGETPPDEWMEKVDGESADF